MIKSVFLRLLPSRYVGQLKCFQILAKDYGQYQSMRKSECVDASGNQPIPWYTYPAIEYLRQFDFHECTVFEYGSGNSSLFWADRALSILSAEDNEEWYNKVKGEVRPNQNIVYRPLKKAYVNAIDESEEKFDIVVVDGNHRPECARQLLGAIKDDGIVILDNSDWFKKTAKYIRESLDFIQVDFHGFGPINSYTWTTSVFISRKAQLRPNKEMQPAFAVGGLQHSLTDDADY